MESTIPFDMNGTDLSNSSLFGVVGNSSSVAVSTLGARPRGSTALGVALQLVYAAGILGNAAAIVALRRGERRIRNRKHLLLLTSLAANDLVALVGMLCAMLAAQRVPGAASSAWYCGARVLLRSFGIGSVCIAVTMALERFLALTRPFLYQKQVTYYLIRWTLLGSWLWAAALTCAPVFGLGLYYNATQRKCVRYREATEPLQFAYAVVYVLFGTLLCVILVYCNLAVIRALYAISASGGGGAGAGAGGGGVPLVRRVSRTSCRRALRAAAAAAAGARAPALHHNAATAEEVAFSRLMATLSVIFMICWLPQMMTAALYLWLGRAHAARLEPLSRAADVLMLLHYVLDPVLYVLMRRRQPRAAGALCRAIADCFKRGHKSSEESMSMKTSCCAPETLVISDSSQGEGRPPRALPTHSHRLPVPKAHAGAGADNGY